MHHNATEQSGSAKLSAMSKSHLSFEELRDWLAGHLAIRAGVSPSSINVAERFQRLGLDSMGASAMLLELGRLLGHPLSPTLAWEYPTPESLARHLADSGTQGTAAVLTSAPRSMDDEPIAIIGMSCRFPKAPNPEAFWKLLRDGVDAITEVPAGRWDINALYDPDPAVPGKVSTKWGGFLDAVDSFDPGFFGISPREAVQIDPQQRIALELAWEALEDALIVPTSLRDSRTGVFFGAMWMDYLRLLGGNTDKISLHTATGQDLSIVPARISYSLGLNGPSMVVNTACSSSLVAVHLACQSLLRGESQMALAGGVNLLLAPESTIAMSKFGAMAPDGRSKAFDSRANGYVRGEGGGVVVLKRLSEARAHGDRIYCVIRGSAVNNDGFSNGLTAPSPRAQEAVLRDACATAGVEPGDIDYVEAHGTGTMLGDPIEAGALGAVLGVGAGRSEDRPLRIGSVKTNIGHLEAAAGMAGLLKVALSMHHRALPKSLHYERPNPHIHFDALRLRVQTELAPWDGNKGRLLAGVSSFGFGGTNCHVVVEATLPDVPRLFMLSADCEEGLRAAARQYAAWLDRGDPLSLEAVCAKAAIELTGATRLSVVVRSQTELGRHLHAFADGQALPGLTVGRAKEQRHRVVFVFGGQGSQWCGMGRALLSNEPTARAVIEQCDEEFRRHVSWSLIERLTSGEDGLFQQTDFVQPAIFALQLAFSAVWRVRGLVPDAVVGQSLGEVAAACVAGVLSLADAAQVICLRSQLVKRTMGQGGMAVVGLSIVATAEALVPFGGHLSIAVSSSPEMTVVAGEKDALQELLRGLQSRGVFCRVVGVDYASHCSQMDPLLPELEQGLAGITPQREQIGFYSTVTAGPLDGTELGAAYWARNLRDPVLFGPVVRCLAEEGATVFIEVDPHPVLTQAIEQCLAPIGRAGTVVTSGRRDELEPTTLLETSGQLLVAGVPVLLDGRVVASIEESKPRLVVLSAKSETALNAVAAQLGEHLQVHSDLPLGDVAFSLAMTRSAMEHRLAIPAASREVLQAALAIAAQGQTPAGAIRGTGRSSCGKLAFLFTGQGSQVQGMGRELHAAWPSFREAFDRCTALFDQELDRPLRDVMWAEPGSAESLLLDQTGYTQPALFALEYALFALWRSWGVTPDVVAGHSIGELCAACVAGVFSLEDAARLCVARGRLIQALPAGGAMVSIAAFEAEVLDALVPYRGKVSIAAVNSPEQVVISGEGAAVAAIADRFATRGVRIKALPVSHAFHSPLMEPMLDAFRQVADSVTYQRPSLMLVGNLNGKLCIDEVCTAAYWVRHVRDSVRFADGVTALHAAGGRTFVELGPKATLLGLVPMCLPQVECALFASLRAGRDETLSMLESLGGLWIQHRPIDWMLLFPDGCRQVGLPTYPWQRQRYWVEVRDGVRGGGEETGHPLLGVRVSAAGSRATFETVLGVRMQGWLGDHRVGGRVLLPGAAVAELIRAAAAKESMSEVAVAGLVLQRPLVLPESGAVRVQVVLTDKAGEGVSAEVYSQAADSAVGEDWTLHATAGVAEARGAEEVDLGAVQARCVEMLEVGAVYQRMEEGGLCYGPGFQGLRSLSRGEGEALGEVQLAVGMEGAGYGVHPVLLDAAFQAVRAMEEESDGELWLPFEMERFEVHQEEMEGAWVYVRQHGRGEGGARKADVKLLNGKGCVIAEVVGLRMQRGDGEGFQRDREREWVGEESMYRVLWKEEEIGEGGGREEGGRWVVVARKGSRAGEELSRRMRGSVVVEVEGVGEAVDSEGVGVQVVCLWERREWESAADGAERMAVEGLKVVQGVTGKRVGRLWWVTWGSVRVKEEEVVGVCSSTVWGLGRTVMQEQPELKCTLIDLEEEGGGVEEVVREVSANAEENQLAWRAGHRYVARLVRVKALDALPNSTDYQLRVRNQGTLDALCLVPDERPIPNEGEVLIEVRASGLNFRDVLIALGRYPGKAGPLGNECAGVILDVGKGVERFSIGEAVMALAPGSFRRFVSVDARLVAPVPTGLSFEQAAGIPVAFLTAWYALHDLADLKAGSRILVHAAAGGVGMAAVQLARWIGAEVYASASAAKWEAVRSLGVEHLASSRTLDFARIFRQASGGSGMDVVLNALAGEFVDASLSLLAAGGLMLEMGKTDVRDPDGVAAAYPGVRYRAFDLWDVDPARIAEMFAELRDGFGSGKLQALPIRVFPITEAQGAFRWMAQGRNVGKLVLVPSRRWIQRECTVLITGGLGALGLHVARWLIRQGVNHLLLTGRRGMNTPGAAVLLAELEALGARVTVAAVDVTDRAALASALAAVPKDLPLRGVVHAAGVLDDGVLTEQSEARFAQVLAPKVAGAWNLHELTAGSGLEFFLMFSSIASLWGSPGQSSYAAANAFLDALASYRQSQGLPGQSLAWGAWSEEGMAAALAAPQQTRFARQGIKWISPVEGITLLDLAMSRPEPHLGVVPLDLRELSLGFGSSVPPLWRSLVRMPPARPAGAVEGAWALRMATLPPERREEDVRSMVQAEVAKVLSLGAPSGVPFDCPLKDLGLDSLMALELRNALSQRVGKKLPATLAFDYPTVHALVRWLLQDVAASSQSEEAPRLDKPLALRDEPVAIVGIGCRFPGGVHDPESFWQLLEHGVDAISEVPKERWDINAYYDPDPEAKGKMTTRWGGFLTDIDRFDPEFFGISPREAVSIDPQQRLLLETSWEALERAGQTPERLLGSDTGVYIGICHSEYQYMAMSRIEAIDAYSLLGTMHSASVGRLSYWLGLKGPNVPVDTACSSSLVAVHLACQALRTGECSMALAGGVNLVLRPESTVYFSRLRAMSPTGRCHTFSADADGYVRSEGAGVVVLKRLSDAQRDGDPILAVIRGSAVNQDGRSNGLTAPNGPAQQAVIQQALKQAGIAPAKVGYVETHGTGTPLGDPIEVQALGAVLGEGRGANAPVLLGSVKSNFGHTEGAAGVAGLIKAVLCLQQGVIPKTLHFRAPNPHIPWSELKVSVAAESRPWPATDGHLRVVGVSSFGFSGTNAHVVLEEAPQPVPELPRPARSAELVTLSARSEAALNEAAARLGVHLQGHPEVSLQDVAYTLATTRSAMEYRLAIAASSREALQSVLASASHGQTPAGAGRGQIGVSGAPKVVFVFPGHGSQWLGMGQQLLLREPVFRDAMSTCDRAILAEAGFSVLAELTADQATSRLSRLDVVQPLLFAMASSLAALWRSWGVTPDVVVGHSMGEIAAAYVAGALSLEDAAAVVCRRSRLLLRITGQGEMALVELSRPEAELALQGYEAQLSVAVCNSPRSTVVAGDPSALAEVLARLESRGVFCRRVKVDFASHSPQVDPLRKDLLEALTTLAPREAGVPMRSTVTGIMVKGPNLGAEYWFENLRQPALFAQAVQELMESGHRLFVEMSPNPLLVQAIEEIRQVENREGAAVGSLRRGQDERAALLSALGSLWVAGQPVAWEKLFPDGCRQVGLPTYPWQRQRYWVEVRDGVRGGGEETGHPLLGVRVSAAGSRATFETVLGVRMQGWLGDHRVGGRVLLPGAAVAELIRAAAAKESMSEVAVAGLVLQRPLVLPESGAVRVQVVLTDKAGEGVSAEVYSQAADSAVGEDWTLHATAGVAEARGAEEVDLGAVQARCVEMLEVGAVYQRMEEGGLCYGPGFQGLRSLSRGEGEALGEVQLAVGMEGAGYGVHPVLLDAAFQAVRAMEEESDGELWLPFEMERFEVHQEEMEGAWVYVRQHGRGEGGARKADVKLLNGKGCVIAEVVGLRMQRGDGEGFQRDREREWVGEESMYRVLWKEEEIGEGGGREEGGRWVVVARKGSRAGEELSRRMRGSVVVEVEGVGEAVDSEGVGVQVVCLWERREWESAADGAERMAVEGLKVVQGVTGKRVGRLWWVTWGSVRVKEEEVVGVCSSTVWGLGRTVMQEQPELKCTLIDLEEEGGGVEEVVREVSANAEENQLAWRAGHRYVARLVRVPPVAGEPWPPLSEPSTVLVTGGLGALGLHVARWLARNGATHLLLTGRRGMATPGAEIAVAELEALGARVTVAAVDVADRAALQSVLAAIPDELSLRGVIHAAGILDDATLAEQNAERFARVLRPKVAGAWNLHELTDGKKLDFFVLFSSAAGLLGSTGQSNYAAANTFLDALALHRRAQGLAAQSLAWGAWLDGGLAAALNDAQQTRLARQGILWMSPSDGIALFELALRRPEAYLGVLKLDLRAVRSVAGSKVPPIWRSLVTVPASRSVGGGKGGWAAHLAMMPPERREQEVRAVVRAEVTRVLSLDAASSVPPDRAFQELGLDSLMAVELRNALGRRVGKTLSATLAFDYPTVDTLSRWLLEHGLDRVEPAGSFTPAKVVSLRDEPIAIVGIGCRYPGGVTDTESFWRLLHEGIDAISEVPSTRWDIDAFYDPDPAATGKMTTRYGGFLSDIDQFDPGFFGISPREAEKMDPQQRLLLETSWEALENAGIAPERLKDSDTGVYVGLMYQEYAGLAGRMETQDGYIATGNAGSVASGRISYQLGLKGPCLTVDTACSSSLVTVHLACQALRQGECTVALAGGVTMMLTPSTFVELSRLRAISPDGRSKSFSAAANGAGFSEGCGMLVLKRRSDAERDGDTILAVILGSAVNQDGRSNGMTAPNGPSQQALIQRALMQADVAPTSVDYVECHGTGTALGDPIEAQALGAVLGVGRSPEHPVRIGSVKSNLGHTQAAAGAAGIIKVVLSLRHGAIPKSLHAETLNPHIPWANLPLRVVTKEEVWPRRGERRIAAVSSFGISGTNAHVVLGEAPSTLPVSSAPPLSTKLAVLSARSEAALNAQVARLDESLRAHPELSLADVAYSLATTRSAMEQRLAIPATSRDGLLAALAVAAQGQTPQGAVRGRVSTSGVPKVVFVFSGQGSQWLGMGRQLLAEEPVFSQVMAACDRAIVAESGCSVLAELAADEASSRLNRIDIVQPILFSIAVALSALWRSWGVTPDAVVGHSMGEIAAAHVAGALCLEDAVAIICRRSRIFYERLAGRGEMAVVEMSVTEAEKAIGGYEERVSVAASNSPRSTVLAGDMAALALVQAKLEAQGVFVRRVRQTVASHSPQVEPLREELLKSLGELKPRMGMVPMRSTVTGTWLDGTELGGEYWAENMRKPVRFAQEVQQMMESGHGLYIEMSPNPLLVGAIEEIRQANQTEGRAMGSLRRGQDERGALLSAVGMLWVQGYEVAWGKQFPSGGRRVGLPTYAWQRQRHWVEGGGATAGGTHQRVHAHAGGHPLMGEALTLSTQTHMRVRETWLDVKRLPWLSEHRVQEAVVFPGAGYVEMALACGGEVFEGGAFEVTGLAFIEPLVFTGDTAVQVQVVSTEEQPGRVSIQVASRGMGTGHEAFRVHARGILRRTEHSAHSFHVDLAALRGRLKASEAAEVYAAMTAMSVDYGAAFRGLTELWLGEGEALGRIQLPKAAGSPDAYQIHPAALDACFQLLIGAMADREKAAQWMAVGVDSVRIFQRPTNELFCHVRLAPANSDTARRRHADLSVVNSDGAVIAEITGFCTQRLASNTRSRDAEDWFLGVEWESTTVPLPKGVTGRWLLIGGGGYGGALRAALEAAGQTVVYEGQSHSSAALRATLMSAFEGKAPTAVVHLGSLDQGGTVDAAAIERELADGWDGALCTVQTLAKMGYRDAPRLWLITRGAQAVGSGDISIAQAPLLGLGRVVALEHADLRCVRLDLDPNRPSEEVLSVVAELLADDVEEEIALRGDQRWVSRLVQKQPETGHRERVELLNNRPFRLEIAQTGGTEPLALRPIARRVPGPGEVEIGVEAAGLSFLDVLKFQGNGEERAGGPAALGYECAGRIVALGDGVKDHHLGQEVVAVAPNSFSSHVTTDARMVAPRPAMLSATQAAAIPLAFTTAWYALVHLGRLRAGERVLIHSASGGIGLAAVQVARSLGADVFATAGTEEKRAWLREQGIAHVMNSRSLDFIEQVLAATGGKGVDVVLNSLSGAAWDANFSTLAVGGRFIDLSHTNIAADRPLGLAHFKKGLSYSAVDVAALVEWRPEYFAMLLREVLGAVAEGKLTALPVQVVPISRAADAFRKMTQAQHIGKLVLKVADPAARLRVQLPSNVAIRSDSSYLLTGGLGGLGLSVAAWLAQQGARHLVLVGRSGAASAEQKAAVAALEAKGARVTVAQADVADRAQMEPILRRVGESGMPLRGVIHLAGLNDPGLLIQQTPAQFRTVMAPKALGALHLHELTRELPLDFFVLYSSVAGLLGLPGVGNYAGANTFLDALAHHRWRQGLPGLSIDWGVFSEVGAAAVRDQRLMRLAAPGMQGLTPAQGVDALARLLDCNEVQIGVVLLNLRQWVGFNQAAAASRRLSRLSSQQGTKSRSHGAPTLLTLLTAADSSKRRNLLEQVLRGQAGQVLGIPEGKLDLEAPLTSMGMDSLMGLELRNRIEVALGIKLSAALLWTYPTLVALAQYLSDVFSVGSKQQDAVPEQPAAAAPAPDTTTSEEPELSDHELLDALRSEL